MVSPSTRADATSSRAAPRGCTNFKLRRLTRRVGRHYDQELGASGLKTTQYSLLAQAERLGPLRPVDLAAAMEMDASTLTRNLRPLVDAGWIAVGPGPDGRTRLVVATETGKALRAEAGVHWKRAQATLNDRLGTERVAALHDLLDGCLGELKADGRPEPRRG